MTPPLAAGGHVPQSTKLLYGLGSVAFGAKGQLLGLLLLFYNQLMGMPAALVSLALAISLTIDAIWDPLVGQVSDNLRTPWGRRHPLMYASAIPLAISWLLLWHPPVGWSHEALFVYLLVMVIAARMFISLYEVPSSALAPELAPDYHARTTLLSYRYLFGTLGAAMASMMGFLVFLKDSPEHPTGQLNQAGYFPYAVVVAGMMVTSILISTAGTHSRIKALHKPPERKASLKTLAAEVASTLSNRNFLVILLAGVFAGMANGLGGGLNIYFATYYWGLTSKALFLLVVVGLLGSFLSAAIAPVASKRWGKKHACIGLFIGGLTATVLPIILRLVGLMPENGTPALLAILAAERLVSATLGIGGYIIVASMVADIVEETQARTGRRSEGLLMSADSLLNKVVGGIATILPGIILAMIEFPDKAKPGLVDADILRNLALAYIPAATVLNMIAIACLRLYRIDAGAHERNLSTIKEAAALAEATAEADLAGSPTSATPGTPG